MKLICATLLLLAPYVCAAQCGNTVAVLKVKIDASESDKPQLVKMLENHGCDHRIRFETADDGFDYYIAMGRSLETRHYLSQAGVGSADNPVVSTTVFDGKGRELFKFARGNRVTHDGAINASAKEIVKRLIHLRSNH